MTDHPYYPGPDDYPEWDTPQPRVHVTLGMQTAVLRTLRAFIAEDPNFAGALDELARRCDTPERWLEALLAMLETFSMYVLASEPRDITAQRLQADLDAADTAMLVNGPGALT